MFALITQTICAVELQNTTTSNIETDVELAKLLLRNLLEIQEKRLPSVINNEELYEYANEWVVEILGGEEVAKETAESEGYKFAGKLRNLENFYVFNKRNLSRRKREAKYLTKSLIEKPNVMWAEQQRIKNRYKRDFIDDDEMKFDDPLWPLQWQLHDSRFGQRTDMNVIGAWKLGYTGKGVVVSILDDGIQHNHTDLVDNYDAKGSYDLNDDDPDPMPTFDNHNRHGTRCAGEVAMAANNSICGVGVAYHAGISGVRMLDGKITDRVESEALNHGIDHVDVYSASWGPNDDGKTVEGPGRLAQAALQRGIKEGRQGKGSIYVWASGNGGHKGDDCDCDGYTDSIYTFSVGFSFLDGLLRLIPTDTLRCISNKQLRLITLKKKIVKFLKSDCALKVSSAAHDGSFPWYGEMCASTLTTTYSTGFDDRRMIVTTDIKNACTTDHSGTSASAPLAAGIIALGLQANPSLTWRDVQHIAVWTSEPSPLLHNEGWNKNSVGLYVNTRFGFGIMNAMEFVQAAKDWKNVPKQLICTTVFPTFTKRSLSDINGTTVAFRTDACEGEDNEINYLEHVQLVLDITYPVRGHLAIYLTSPNGTKTQLLSVRREDKSKAGFRSWPFMSVHSWGEEGKGRWQLEVNDRSGIQNGNQGSVNNITLILYGTKEAPAHYATPRKYNMKYNVYKNRPKRSV
ncbi:unnamed protein product [Enterobius vermicularis]|uniref:P/Homo B domain-containing protein n=1 Tax=Enterobius vermicularis TaxID=51028 RepID=A0A3P6J217_ENTVE|nr:unnamed protein product [Enterobius vermicularis]